MRRVLFVLAVVATVSLVATASAHAAPPGLPDDNPNESAVIMTVVCPDFNDGQPFQIWIPNANGWQTAGAAPVGHPIDVDVPVAVEKRAGNGAHDRTVLCLTPLGIPAPVMPTGKPTR